MRHPRERHPTTLAETAAIAEPHNVYYETAQAWNEAVDGFLTDAVGHR